MPFGVFVTHFLQLFDPFMHMYLFDRVTNWFVYVSNSRKFNCGSFLDTESYLNPKKYKYLGKSHRKKNSAPKRSFSGWPNFDQIWPTSVQRFDQLLGLFGNFLWTLNFFLWRTSGISVLEPIIILHSSIKKVLLT